MSAGAVAITGIGALCSIGAGTAAIRTALHSGQRGLGPLRYQPFRMDGTFGEVPRTNAELAAHSALADRTGPWSRTFLLALHAAQEALLHSGITDTRNTAFISASTVGGMDVTEQRYDAWKQAADMPSAADVRLHPVGHHARAVAQALGLNGLVTTISTACSSSANALMFGAELIRAGRAPRVLAGGADALCRFTIAGFGSLGALDPLPCRPFTDRRAGLNLGEGAAYLMLEPLDSVRREGRSPLAVLSGHANRNDAFHITATSPEGRGPFAAMHAALQQAGIAPSDVGHINAHGTGTPNNDDTELHAIERLFPVVPPFCSTKALTGHTLAAAGALEAVFAVLAIQDGVVPCGAPAEAPMTGHRSVPTAAPITMPLRHVLSNSFGFGGNDTALVLSAAP